jgi:hypothetical protein
MVREMGKRIDRDAERGVCGSLSKGHGHPDSGASKTVETPGKMLDLYVLGGLTSRRAEGQRRPLDGVHLEISGVQ